MVEKDAVIERQHYKGLAWVASMALFMQSLDATILNTALPTIATDLQTPVFEMQMAIIAYSLAVALFIPLTAWAAAKILVHSLFSALLFLPLYSARWLVQWQRLSKPLCLHGFSKVLAGHL